jgi:hypothetical protein
MRVEGPTAPGDPKASDGHRARRFKAAAPIIGLVCALPTPVAGLVLLEVAVTKR